MRWRPSIWVALALAATPVTACTTTDEPNETSDSIATAPDGWAHEVMPWMAEFELQMRTNGGLGALPFLSPDAVLDVRTVANYANYFEGLDAVVAYFDAVTAGVDPLVDRLVLASSPLVDPEGLVMPMEYDRSVRPGTPPSLPAYGALVLDIGPTGIERWVMLPSTDWWRDDAPVGSSRPADVALSVTSAWVDAWSGDDGDRVRTLYGPGAIVADEISGIAVRGQQAIVDQWTVAPATSWSIVARGSSQAVYLWKPPYGPRAPGAPDMAVLAQLDGSVVDGCPGEVAVWWELDEDARITKERRFRSVADSRRCAAPVDLPAGWWTGRPIPGRGASAAFEDLDTVTSRISHAGMTVAIHHGTPSLASLVGWALARFDLAGLRLPAVNDVTFTDFTDYCADVQGRTIRLPEQEPLTDELLVGGWAIVLCFGEDDLYLDDGGATPSALAEYVVLHELAHVWVDQYVDERRREYFGEWLEVPTWADRSFDWDQRGGEWAASLVAWGLMDTPMPLFELGEPPIELRIEGFQLLTGRAPLVNGA